MTTHHSHNFTTRILEVVHSLPERLNREAHWQNILNTHYPHGINDTPPYLTPFNRLPTHIPAPQPPPSLQTTNSPHNNNTHSNNIVNLSHHQLTSSQISLLDRGLKFIPTPTKIHTKLITDSLTRFTRNLKLKSFFADSPNTHYDPLTKTFEGKSDWTPPMSRVDPITVDAINHIENFTHQLINKEQNNNHILTHEIPNLTKAERDALKQLTNLPDIIIKPADKGSAIVIMDREAYTYEAQRQLLDRKYYHSLDQPVYPINSVKIKAILQQMYSQGYINNKQLQYLLPPPQPRPRLFYLLPKIHKPPDKWTLPHMPQGRPIVSDCNSESYRIAEFLDHFITPLSIRHPAYLKDTYHFLSLVQNLPVPSHTLLFTADVTSLYTNMDLNRTIQVVKQAFLKYPQPGRPDDLLIQLLTITLKGNDLMFGDQFWLQVMGVAMGKRFAPGLANIFLFDLDDAAMTGFHIRPGLYGRFLDDIFGTWMGTREQLLEFQDFLNTLIPNIHLTFTIHEHEINFLDTTIYKHTENGNTTLRTRLYTKPTDTHQLLHTKSHHPPHTCKGVLKSQFIRFKRICSTKTDYDAACKNLHRALGPRGYSDRLMRALKSTVWHSTPNLSTPTPSSNKELLPIVIPYTRLTSRLVKNWINTLEERSLTNNLRPIKAFSTLPNLHKSLVHTRF